MIKDMVENCPFQKVREKVQDHHAAVENIATKNVGCS